MRISLSKEFMTRIRALKISGKRRQYEQVSTILMELETDDTVSKRLHPDSRLPECLKFELMEGYRIVFQKVGGKEPHLLALFVGSHDDTDKFLDNHKGWFFDPQTNGLKRLNIASYENELINIVPSSSVQEEKKGQVEEMVEPIFSAIGSDLLIKAGLTEEQAGKAMVFSDPDSREFMSFLESLPAAIGDKLLGYVCGDAVVRNEIVEYFKGNRIFEENIDERGDEAIATDSEQFIDLGDLSDAQRSFDSLPLEDWMLFLHPSQKEFVIREFTGPARLRGVSGSGKTVVAIHRAREGARKIKDEGYNKYVLLLTYNRSLADLVERLIGQLCSSRESERIKVMTIDKWCRDYLIFRRFSIPAWSNEQRDAIWRDCIRKYREDLVRANLLRSTFLSESDFKYDQDLQFLDEEIDFIMGKFVHQEKDRYLDCDRTGRVKRLTKEQRRTILEIYDCYISALTSNKQILPKEINRIALSYLCKAGEFPELDYADIIVDEVQDLSEIELLLVKQLALLCRGNLYLVGDGAQKIYTRGYSMKNLGINVVGRSFVLRQNYRNTREIMHSASMLRSAQQIGRYDEDPEIAQTTATYSTFSGEKPVFIIAKNPQHESEIVAKEIKYLMKQMKLLPYEICCLARSDWERKGLLATLNKAGIKAIEYKAEGIGDTSAVKISTLHNSKGHEFKAVFICGFFDGAIPLQVGATEPEELEKEAALLYVAMTRAKQLLYLLCPKTDKFNKELKPSRFLADIASSIDVIDWSN